MMLFYTAIPLRSAEGDIMADLKETHEKIKLTSLSHGAG